MNYSIENKYIGNLRTVSTHLDSKDKITTDAPTDNNGKGQAFAPTDLVSSALCSCMTTVMGICAEKGGFKMPNSTAKITKLLDNKLSHYPPKGHKGNNLQFLNSLLYLFH